MRRLNLLLVLALSACASAQEGHDHATAPLEEPVEKPVEAPLTSGKPAPPEQTCFDVLHYSLAVRVEPETKSIQAGVKMRALWLAESPVLQLDLDDHLEVTRTQLLWVGDTLLEAPITLPFEHRAGALLIEVGDAFEQAGVRVGGTFSLTVDYNGQPRIAPRPPWDGGFQWETTADGSPWIASSCQMQGADLWWPCKDQPDDEPDSMDIFVRVPEGLICASNGKLVKTTTEDGWTLFHWQVSTPINIYGIALNIAPYVKLTRQVESITGEEFEVSYWVLPENEEKGKVLFEDLVRQVRWFEETYGPYPFRADKCGLVETPHLGMEHQSITAYGATYQGNPWGVDQGFDFLLHHELSHEWWANLVTCRNWKDFWIHESFATYAQSLYTEHLNGPAAYRVRMAEIRRGIHNRGPIAPRQPMTSADVYFGKAGNDIYNKGAWVLHTLRWLANDDEAFFYMLRRMAYPDPAMEATSDGSACRFTDTEEILALAEKHLELDLGWFFEAYTRQASLPRLVQDHQGDELHLQWVHPDVPDLVFPMPVEILIGDELMRIEMPGGKATINVRGVESLKLDPNAWLLRE